MEHHQEQQKEQSACKRSAHVLLLKICPNVTEHTQRYFFKNIINNLQQRIDVDSSRKEEIEDESLLLDSRYCKKAKRGENEAKKDGFIFPLYR